MISRLYVAIGIGGKMDKKIKIAIVGIVIAILVLVIGIGITIEFGEIEECHSTEGECLSLIVVEYVFLIVANRDIVDIFENDITVLYNLIRYAPVRGRCITLPQFGIK